MVEGKEEDEQRSGRVLDQEGVRRSRCGKSGTTAGLNRSDKIQTVLFVKSRRSRKEDR